MKSEKMEASKSSFSRRFSSLKLRKKISPSVYAFLLLKICLTMVFYRFLDKLITPLGKSALLFTYGVTNAGKTHTIIGPSQDPGILPRSIELILNYCNQIFDTMIKDSISLETTENLSGGLKMENILILQNHPEYALKDIKIFLESFEIYNEDIYDLLAEYKKDKISGNLIRPKLQMKEGDNKKVYVKGLNSIKKHTFFKFHRFNFCGNWLQRSS